MDAALAKRQNENEAVALPEIPCRKDEDTLSDGRGDPVGTTRIPCRKDEDTLSDG